MVDELIVHPKTRWIQILPARSKVGRIIAEKAGRHLKRALLELGGKAPMIGSGGCGRRSRRAAAANFGAFMNQGQICMSTERIVVESSGCRVSSGVRSQQRPPH